MRFVIGVALVRMQTNTNKHSIGGLAGHALVLNSQKKKCHDLGYLRFYRYKHNVARAPKTIITSALFVILEAPPVETGGSTTVVFSFGLNMDANTTEID